MNKTKIKIDKNLIINNGFTINSNDFALLIGIVLLKEISYNDEIKISHLKGITGFSSNKRIKKSLNSLYEEGIIQDQIIELPRNQIINIKINEDLFNGDKEYITFSFDDLNNVINISPVALRLYCYIKFFKKDNKYTHNGELSYKYISAKLNLDWYTIKKYLKILEDINII